MDKGAKAIARILVVAVLLGVVVALTHPDYRATVLAIARHHPALSPLWISNRDYYPAVQLPPDDHAR